MYKKTIPNSFLFLIFLILYLPIIFLIAYSFNDGNSMYGWKGFSLRHYNDLFNDQRLLKIIAQTLFLTLISSVIATIIGIIGSLLIYRTNNIFFKKILLNFNSILLISPDVIIGVSFLTFFTFLGISLNFFSVLLSHIAFSIPIVVLMILPRLISMPKNLIYAAEDLGASFSEIFKKIIFPYISPSVLSGFLMAVTYSLDDFAVTFFVTGDGFSTLTVEIFSRSRQGVDLEINALSTFIFIISSILVYIYFRVRKNEKK